MMQQKHFPNLLSKYNLRTTEFFKNLYGEPFILVPGQEEIFKIIYEPSILRGAITAITQYGKSEVASMALICAAVERKEKILIIAPSTEQASIIMTKVIEHLFDDPWITSTIEYSGRLERLRHETSKTRITFKNGSEIRILTADARTISREARGLMGFGATLVLVDESALIPDTLFSKILRMVGGVRNGKLIQLSNPFEENHFDRALHNPKYVRVQIDWRQALGEGRVTQEFLDEAKAEMPEMDWIVFYESRTPKKGLHNQVIPSDWVDLAVEQKLPPGEEEMHVGLDIARFGGDKTVYTKLRDGYVSQKLTEKLDNMEVVGWVRPFLDEDEPDSFNADVVGLGAGVVDRLSELDYDITPIDFGATPPDKDAAKTYANMRAYVYFCLRNLFKPVNGMSRISIPNDVDLIKELKAVTYGYTSERRIKLTSKDDLKKIMGRSPDKADSLALAAFSLTEDEPQMIIG